MSKLRLNIRGIDSMLAKFSRFDKAQRVVVRSVVKKSANRIRKTAKLKAPRDTGYLQKVIRATYSSDGLSASIYPRSSLAHFQEFGTVEHRAQPFMTPTAAEELPKYLNDMEDELRKVWKG